MKAAVVGESALEIRDVPQPKPKPNEVLIKVRAIGLNRAGGAGAPTARAIPADVGTIPGIECAGEVVEIGSRVQGVKVGDRVMGSGQGTYAEYTVVDWGRTTPIPANNMSWEQAATFLPSALGAPCMTRSSPTRSCGRAKACSSRPRAQASASWGCRLRSLKAQRLVIGTSTNDARRAKLKDHGADLAIDARQANWSGRGVEGDRRRRASTSSSTWSPGPAFNENMKAMAVLGRIVNVERLGGGRRRVRFQSSRQQAHRLYRRHPPHALIGRAARRSAQHARRSMGCGDGRANYRFRSTARSSSTRRRRRRRICAPTSISARS